ncbi:enoyl-CoA hydratase/isomerase family protein [Pararhodobacter sp.]|uniref:enoyl-CoA hydratase/isomerase family protein n=1 Tax=Pararhodobacter sp. TaxID=2127056 RepID=UPI002AFFEEFC|nr:enoyl-CoA hydratase-related protein [Pararhodobacter sp.]
MSEVTLKRDGHVLIITLNRPDVLNAWNTALIHGLHAAWKTLAADPDLRVAVLHGAGRIFTAGLDLKEVPRDGILGIPNMTVPCRKPILVAVEGAAIGYGAVTAMFADMVFAAESAYFLYPEAKMGVFQGLMGGFPGRVQYKAGLQWLLTAEKLGATRAREIGLVNEVLPDGQAFDRALEVARKIATHAPLVVQAIKDIALGTIPKGPMEQNLGVNRMIEAVMSSHDAQEGMKAAQERRVADFKGD